MDTILIKNGTVFDTEDNRTRIADIFIAEGKIQKIAKGINTEADKIINADGKWITPGFIDLHAHLRDPGFTDKETIATGSASAAVGGFTTICCMPNTNPAIHNAEVVNYVKNKAEKESPVNILPIGAITYGQQGEELTDIKGMYESGICALSEDGKSVLSAKMLKDAMLEAKHYDLPIFSHCEDISLVNGGCINEGYASKLLNLKGISDDSESVIVARDIALAKSTGVRLHICHISTKGSIDLLRDAQKRGVKVTAEACPHHFALCDEFITRPDTNTKMNPPLRSRENMEALREALKDGTIAVIATDHAPHTAEDKNKPYDKAPFGIVGFETALSLGVTCLTETGILTPEELIRKMTYNPAQIIKSPSGVIKEGLTADIAVIDPNEEYTVNCNDFISKSKNSPFGGFKLRGRVKYTICGGRIVLDNGRFVF